jgi:prophage regulatory protein
MDPEKSKAIKNSASLAAKGRSPGNGPSLQSATEDPVFLRRRAVEARTGLPRSSIYDRIAAGEFPKPVPLGGRSVGWLESEIVEWQKARIAERAHKAILRARRSAR